MNSKDFVKFYYDEMKKRHYKPLESWGRDCKQAKRFVESGRTFEDFQNLLNKAFLGPKDIQIATCQGLHKFMYLLPKIELLDQAPWEPSPEERAANVRFIDGLIESVKEKWAIQSGEPKWVKNPKGGWMRAPK